MKSLLQSIFNGVVRHLATAAAGYLVTQGVLDGSNEQAFIGSVIFLAGVAWSAYQKYSVHKAGK